MMRQKLTVDLPSKKKMLGRENHLICKIHEESRNFQIDIRAISEDVGQILCWFKLWKKEEKKNAISTMYNFPFPKNYLFSAILRVSNEWKYECVKGQIEISLSKR